MTPESSNGFSPDILVVDDNPDNVRVLSKMLLDQGYRVRKAIVGSMAITAVKTVLPDLILLDINMPGMNGYEVCAALKEDPATCSVPIIFLSALDDIDNKVKAFSSGGVDYITKPFQFEEVLVRIQNQLTIRRLQKEVHERNEQLQTTLLDLKQAQSELIQKGKMAGLGQLVAGVSHQINNPISFISGNIAFVEKYIQELLTLIQIYQQEYSPPTPTIQAVIESIDLEFVQSDLQNITGSMRSGISRLQAIILALRIFSRLDEATVKSVNIHEGIESVLLLLQHRLAPPDNSSSAKIPIIKIIKDYATEIPPIVCYASELNQVFLNLLNNAIDAFGSRGDRNTKQLPSQRNSESSSASQSTVADPITTESTVTKNLVNVAVEETEQAPCPTIWIRTEVGDRGTTIIRIKDNGTGMSDEVRSRIFEPFFTTKPPSAGGGLGLTSSYQIIVDHHRGSLTCWSEPGKGSEFVVEVPIRSHLVE